MNYSVIDPKGATLGSVDQLLSVIRDTLSSFTHTLVKLWASLHYIFGWPCPENILKIYCSNHDISKINRFKDTSHPLHWKNIKSYTRNKMKFKQYLDTLLSNAKFVPLMRTLGFSTI